MRVYVMVGAPGAGKGTQAALLSDRLRVPHVASGDLFRDHIKRETTLGKKVKGYLDKGALVPDDLTVRMISERLRKDDAAEGVILDGFPRTRPQAEALDRMLDRQAGRVAAALYIDVDREVLTKRLAGRWVCSASADHGYHEVARPPRVKGRCDVDGAALYQRDDDKPATIKARLEQQLPPMYEVIDYYADRGVLNTVQGDRPMDEVTEALVHALAGNGRKTAEAPDADRFALSTGGKSDGGHPGGSRQATGPRVADQGPAAKKSHGGGQKSSPQRSAAKAHAGDGRTPADTPGADRLARSGRSKAGCRGEA